MTVAPFDAGLQPERTLLAWRRTFLSLALGIAVAVRLTAPDLGAISIIGGVVGLALVAVGWVGATRHYRRAHEALSMAKPLDRGAGTLAATAEIAAALGLLGFWFFVGGWRL